MYIIPLIYTKRANFTLIFQQNLSVRRKKTFLKEVLLKSEDDNQTNIVMMEKTIAYLIFDLQCIAITISFIVGLHLKLIKSTNLFDWDIYVFMYTCIAFFVMFLFFLSTHKLLNIPFVNELNNILVFFNFAFFSSLIIKKTKGVSKKSSYIIYLIQSIILMIMISEFFSPDEKITEMKMKVFSLNHLGLLFVTFIYIIYLSKNLPEKSILKLPDFWIVLGVALCSIINFPIMLTAGFFFNISPSNKTSYLLSAIAPLGYFIQYSFITYSFLCNREKAIN
jgi:hypothetical protein